MWFTQCVEYILAVILGRVVTLSSMIPRLTTPETHDYLGDDNEGLTRPAGQVRSLKIGSNRPSLRLQMDETALAILAGITEFAWPASTCG